MYVAEAHIASFRHLRDAHIGPLPEPGLTSDIVVLAGPNGGGKSSVLELLAFALSNTWGWSWAVGRTWPESSFELRFGLSTTDIERLEEDITRDPGRDPHGLLPELRNRRSYYRSFNYPDGEYAKDSTLHDRMHSLVSRSLGEHTRALFLRSGRYYTQKSYQRNKIFDSQRRLETGYLRNYSFTLTDQQYTDQMEFLIEQGYNYPRTVGVHTLDLEDGVTSEERPPHPLDSYDALFQRLFPQYSLQRPRGEVPPDRLYIRLPDGKEVPFTDLSSGEQEVFFLLSFFLRHDIQNSMIFIDEPELHLHPELARRMVRIMLGIRPSNQVWLGTHTAELIEEAGRDRTYFMSRPAPTETASSSLCSDEDEFVQAIRTLFGFGGYVGLARHLVFLEGDASSPDRRVLITLFPEYADHIRFVPLNSSENVPRVHRAILSILQEGLSFFDFSLIRDRDYLPNEVIAKYEQDASGRLFVLRRHEIENYLLDAQTISEVVSELHSAMTPEQAEERLREVARSLVGAVLRDMVAARLNRHFQLQDCSIGRFEAHSQWLDSSLSWDDSIVSAASGRFRESFGAALREVTTNSTVDEVEQHLACAKEEIVTALQGSGWKDLFPGKELLNEFGIRIGFGRGPVFVNAVIRKMGADSSRVNPELRQIMERIVEDKNIG